MAQIDTNSGVKRENPGNASLSQLLLTSPFGSDSCRFAHNEATNNMEMEGSSAPAGQVQVRTDPTTQNYKFIAII